jgi:hypothetical protein
MPRLMSSGGRIQLINSVLSAIPNFFMACIEWDQASIDAVDKLRRAFLWKNKDKILGGHCLVAWDIVTMPKKNGGLGIRDLRHTTGLSWPTSPPSSYLLALGRASPGWLHGICNTTTNFTNTP